MSHTNMIITEVYHPFILCMLLSETFGIHCIEQSSSNRACIPLLPLEAILLHGCQSVQIDALILCFRVENMDSQTYVNPNIDSILSAAA